MTILQEMRLSGEHVRDAIDVFDVTDLTNMTQEELSELYHSTDREDLKFEIRRLRSKSN